MKKRIARVIALALSMALLAGCGSISESIAEELVEIAGSIRDMVAENGADTPAGNEDIITFEQMKYVRPDMEMLEKTLDTAIEAAAGEDFSRIIDMIYEFYDVYDSFYTNYNLADIHYCCDLTNSYWEEEYNFCIENSARVDAALEELFYALADSPCRRDLERRDYFGEGYFDSYDGENNWDEEFTALLDREAELQSKYYELSDIGAAYEEGSEEYYAACGDEMAELLVELVRLRQTIAAYWGYEDYTQFATDFYYYRDYTAAQSAKYLDDIQEELVGLYREVNKSEIWDGFTYCTEGQTYAYVEEMAGNMGGVVKEAFDVMDRGGLYDIGYGKNKYPSSFEVYLTSYYVPFIFMDPSESTYDKLTFAHEFGHFCNDYASYGSYAGVDVLEFFSQGMEYLSLCYVEDAEALTRLKMADSLCVYVEQAAFAKFEMEMYKLKGEELTVEKLMKLYDRVAQDYGFESVGYDPREFVTITHYYTNPLYILSYVVSNDAAMQLYQMEQEALGKGLACFEKNLDTEESYFLAFLEATGLESPFAAGRLQTVRATFEEIFE